MNKGGLHTLNDFLPTNKLKNIQKASCSLMEKTQQVSM
jgi:hypothetical protein